MTVVKAARYINLDARTDRAAEFCALRLPFPLARTAAVPRPERPAAGCALSHVKALDELLADGAGDDQDDWYAVFEDDFRPTPYGQGDGVIQARLAEALVPAHNLVCLAYRLLRPDSAVWLRHGMLELRGVYTASGYAVRRGFIPDLRACFAAAAAGLEAGRGSHECAIDVAWCALQTPGGGFVAPWPKLGEQRPSYSDIELREVDYAEVEHGVQPPPWDSTSAV